MYRKGHAYYSAQLLLTPNFPLTGPYLGLYIVVL